MRAGTSKEPERLDLQQLIVSPEALSCLTADVATRLCVLPVSYVEQLNENVLIVACADASSIALRERVVKHIDHDVRLQLLNCPADQLGAAIEDSYRTRQSLEVMLTQASKCGFAETGMVLTSDYPVELVNALLRQAARMRASDIHLSPELDCVQVRFRVDGVLLPYASLDKSLLNGLVVRIKIMASLDIAETRYPQDGQFRRFIDAYPIDFRVSTFPTVAGENTVLRLIDKQMQLYSLSSLQLPSAMLKKLSTIVKQPEGLIVVCGPTGAGKSTTLFAMLEQINHESLSIMTLEDPVEHRVAGIRQTTVYDARHWGYAQGLRALLRQDPDVLLIGEIRDAESCEMALRAVSTGHQIMTTVHANCAHTALHRLRELQASGGALALGLVAMIAQRLVRKVCKVCSATDECCKQCHGTGYSGRQVIMELLEVTTEIKSLLVAEADISEIQQASGKAGFLGMREQAMAMVAAGETSLQEVNRVFGAEVAWK
ncbi:MAG: GspE/PulE family protein [Granulosicoccus sp.]